MVVAKKVEKNPNRILKGTKASEERALSQHELDGRDASRAARGAHADPVAMGAYDLKFGGGRSVPSWRRGV